MLEIDVKKISEYNLLLSNTIDYYITNQDNMEFKYKDILAHWINNKAVSFFVKVDANNLESRKLINSLQELLKVFELLTDKYNQVGSYIECDLQSNDYIKDKLNNYIQRLNVAYNSMNNLGDISFYSKSDSLRTIRKNILNETETMKNISDSIKGTYSSIIEIEKELGNRLNNITVPKVNSDDVTPNTNHVKNEMRVDVDELELSSKKLDYYIKQQITSINDIEKYLNGISSSYNSHNSSKLVELNSQICSSLKKCYNNNVQYLSQVKLTIQDAIELEQMNISNWENMK